MVVSGLSMTVGGLEPGTRYGFRIHARNAVGWGDWRGGVFEWTDTPAATPTPTPTPTRSPTLPSPPAPTGLTARPGSGTEMHVSWTGRTGVGSYLLLKQEDGGPWTDAYNGSNTTPMLAGYRCGRSYRFRVRGFGDGTIYSGAGPYSHSEETAPVVPVQCPTAPNLRVSVSGRDVTLSWTADANVERYGVERSSTGSWVEVTDQATGSGHTLANHACGAHVFRVRALGNGIWYAPRWSDYSREETVTALCGPTPTPISVGYQSDKTVKYALGTMIPTWTPTPTPDTPTPAMPTPTQPRYDDPAILIPTAIPAGVTAWNNKLQTRPSLTGLLICKGMACDDDSGDDKNGDMHIVTVNVLDDHLSGCGDAGIACVAPVSRAGNPLGAMDLVIGEEAWSIGIRRSSGGHTLPAR